jgi:hypothetical protein
VVRSIRFGEVPAGSRGGDPGDGGQAADAEDNQRWSEPDGCAEQATGQAAGRITTYRISGIASSLIWVPALESSCAIQK